MKPLGLRVLILQKGVHGGCVYRKAGFKLCGGGAAHRGSQCGPIALKCYNFQHETAILHTIVILSHKALVSAGFDCVRAHSVLRQTYRRQELSYYL